jgi:uncharacterized protein (TIGR03086 family)
MASPDADTSADAAVSAATAAERFRRVAGRFSQRAAEVPADAWSNPAPCTGWTARDVVRHLTDWVPAMIGRAGIDLSVDPSVDQDPVAAWTSLAAGLQRALEDPAVAGRVFDAGQPGRLTVAQAIDMLVTGDVLVHTWDLARATGLDESLDEDVAASMYEGLQAVDDALRASGHYGEAVPVPDDADIQTKLIAFTGRRP